MWTIVFGRVAQFLLMLATLKLATHFLTPSDMGKIAIVTSTVAFISSFLINPIGMYINRQLHGWYQDGSITTHMQHYVCYLFIVALLSAGSVGLCHYFHLLLFHMPNAFVIGFVFLTLFFNTINQTAIPSLNLLGFRSAFTLLSIATVFCGLFCAVFFVNYFSAKSQYWLLGILLGQIVFALVGSWIFYQKARQPKKMIHKPDFSVIKIMQFAWPIALATGLTWCQSQSYRFFLEQAFGLGILGLFVAGYGISAGIMAGFESVFSTYFQPLFYKAVSNGNQASRARAWNQYALVVIPSTLVLAFTLAALSHQLATVMLAPSFQMAAQFVVWGAFAEAFRVVGNVYNMVAHSELNTKMLIMPNLIGACASLVSIYFLLPYLGVTGVALALVLAGGVVVLFLHMNTQKQLSTRVPYQEIMCAIGFGLLIVGFNGAIGFLVQSVQISIYIQFLAVGMIFMLAQYYLLKVKGGYPWE